MGTFSSKRRSDESATIVSTGTTTLVAAIAAFIFQLLNAGPPKLTVMHCYLFLSPLPFLIFGLSMLAAHRHDIYRMGYYINVFFEEKYGGAEWGIRSFRFREIMKGETQDSTTFLFWSLFFITVALFLFSIYHAKGLLHLHFLSVCPFFIAMFYQHLEFTKDRTPIKDIWLEVEKEQK